MPLLRRTAGPKERRACAALDRPEPKAALLRFLFLPPAGQPAPREVGGHRESGSGAGGGGGGGSIRRGKSLCLSIL